MDMKWHPIVNGDLSGIPKYEHFLFTIDDELGVKSLKYKRLKRGRKL